MARKHYLTADGQWKSECNPYLQHRASGHDYSQPGTYMITLCTNRREPLFGKVVEKSGVVVFEPSAVGRMVERRWCGIGEHSPEITIQDYQLMPDHLHGILWVREPLAKPLGQVIRGFKMGATAAYRALMRDGNVGKGGNVGKDGNVGNVGRGGWGGNGGSAGYDGNNGGVEAVWQPKEGYASLDKEQRAAVAAESLWENNYNDRISFTRERLEVLRAYIHDNPRRLWLKRQNSEYFALMRNVRVETTAGSMLFSAMGNMALLENADKQVVQCSRSMSGNRALMRDALCQAMERAEKGALIISAAISKGEKEICRAIREAGFALVVLMKDGFPAADSPHSRYYKPGGLYFEACSKGQLLLLEPERDTFLLPDIRLEVERKAPLAAPDSSRYRFLALNSMAWRIAEFCRVWQ